MTATHPPIYLATVALEKNRWASDRSPTFLVSDWLAAIADAGFDGVELWENHALRADAAERDRLAAAPLPITLYNTYCGFDDDQADARHTAATMAKSLGARGCKFNLGGDATKRDEYVRNLRAWRDQWSDDADVLCECHAGTVAQIPEDARQALRDAGDRFGIMLHAFNMADDDIRLWFDHFGDQVRHIHVQCVGEQKQRVALSSIRDRARSAVATLKSAGFNGSFAIEFVEGTGSPDESVERLFAAAVRELTTLRELLT